MTAPVRHQNRATLFGDVARLVGLLPPSPPANDTEPPTPGAPAYQCPELKWIHCANVGVYRGHHQGEFELTEATFAQMIANFRRDPKYIPGPVTVDGAEIQASTRGVVQFDFEHASEMAPWEGSIPATGAPAVGWVLELDVRPGPDGKPALYALGKLGQLVRGYIETSQYESVSIAWNPAGIHWVTGEPIGAVLTSIAFTNHPFVRDLAPLAAANRAAGQVPKSELQPRATNVEAHTGGPPSNQSSGAMTPELRSRLCSIYALIPQADDPSVIRAAENAATNGVELAGLLKALGYASAADGLEGIKDLMSARTQLQEALTKIDSIMRGDEMADAGVAQQDVAAAFSAKRYTDPVLVQALTSHREGAITTEIGKLTADKRKDVAEVRAARERGRAAFLAHFGVVTNPVQQHLTSTFVAGPGPSGSVQFAAPLPAPAPVQFGQPPRPLQLPPVGAPPAASIDLSAFTGRNLTEKVMSYLASQDANFSKLDIGERVRRASAWRKANEQHLQPVAA